MLRDSSVLFVGNWFGLVIAIMTSALVARILGPDQFGLVTLAMVSVNFVIQFIDAQTDEALIRFMGSAIARGQPGEARTFFYMGVLTDMGVALLALWVVIMVVPPIIVTYPQGTELQRLVNIFLVSAPFTILQSNFDSVFVTLKRFRLSVVLSILVNLFSLVLLVTLATQGVVAVMWGYVTVVLVKFALFSIVALVLLHRELAGSRAEGYGRVLRMLMPFVFHTSFMGSLKSIALNIDTLLLGALAGTSAVSYYSIARSAAGLIALPVTPVSTVIYPLLNEAWAVDNLARVKYLIRRFMVFSAAVSISIALAFVVLADVLVSLVYGPEFLPVGNLIRIMCIGMVLESVMGWVRRTAMSGGKPQLATFSNVTAILIRLVVTIPLIYLYSASGAAIAYNIGVVVSVVVNVFYVLPRLNIWRPRYQT